MIEVKPHAERHADRAGDPLDGLVNMFDLGIVLALAFLLAALQSANLTELLTNPSEVKLPDKSQKITVKPNEQLKDAKTTGQRVAGTGVKIGTLYRMPDGRIVSVLPK